ncbi:MAG: helix-turn-helix domain-containing protein [Candidatus Omnitrophota bacterium]
MKKNIEREFVTIPQLAKIMGLSRIAVFKKVKQGEIKAMRVGRGYIISKEYVDRILGKSLTPSDKQKIDKAVRKTVKEYSETLKLLGRE